MNDFEDSDDEEGDSPEFAPILVEHDPETTTPPAPTFLENLTTSVAEVVLSDDGPSKDDLHSVEEGQPRQTISLASALALQSSPQAPTEPVDSKMLRVVVKDVAYITYYAILYYVSPFATFSNGRALTLLHTDIHRYNRIRPPFIVIHWLSWIHPPKSCRQLAADADGRFGTYH